MSRKFLYAITLDNGAVVGAKFDAINNTDIVGLPPPSPPVTPGGADTQIQFNDAGAFGAAAGPTAFIYNKTNGYIQVLAQAASVPAGTFGGFGGCALEAGAFNSGTLAGFGARGNYGGNFFGCLGVLDAGFPGGAAGGWFHANSLATSVTLADNANAITILAGSLSIPGTNGNTLRWEAGVTAPATNAGTPTTRYGGDTNYLGDPDAWVLVNIAGTNYKIPAYL